MSSEVCNMLVDVLSLVSSSYSGNTLHHMILLVMRVGVMSPREYISHISRLQSFLISKGDFHHGGNIVLSFVVSCDMCTLEPPLELMDWNVGVDQYHSCWCPGIACCQGISNYGIDLVGYTSPCLSWGKFSMTHDISAQCREITKCRKIFVFHKSDSAY